MALFFEILGFALFVFWLLLIARVVVEFIRSFSRDWQPKGLTVVVLEVIMTVTDPPVKLLRRLIPQLTPELLDRMTATVAALGYAGEAWLVRLLYLVLTSRLLSRPLNVVVGGPSGAGKTFVVTLVASCCP